MRRGEVWWASLPEPGSAGAGFRRPVLVIQSDSFNESRIHTVIVAAITSNVRLAHTPGNVLFERRQWRLPRDSVINASQLLTIDKVFLTERVSLLRPAIMARVEAGLKLVLGF